MDVPLILINFSRLSNIKFEKTRFSFARKLRYGYQLRNLYRQALSVIVPTLAFESFGQVIVEAFLQQTPAIVRDLGECRKSLPTAVAGLCIIQMMNS